MTGAYVYTPGIWPPLAAAIFLAALCLYSWRRRSVPAALPLAACALFGALWLLGLVFVAAAVAPGTKIAWHKFQAAWHMPVTTAMTCFALEYTYPGRWLTRRNLTLLALPSLLFLLMLLINDSQFAWRSLQVGPDGTVVRHFATPGLILMAYGLGLILVNAAAFLWLFIRSPQHRWPVTLMLFGQIVAFGLYLLDAAQVPLLTLLDLAVGAVLAPWTMYAIALFGFRIFDPLPAARATALQQMREGMVVFDDRWRIVSLNPAAERILGAPAARARGKTWHEVLPPSAILPGLSVPAPSPGGAGPVHVPPVPAEVTLGSGADARCYALDLSPLKDQRRLEVGRLLLLHDVTEQRRAQAQLLEQQRTLAVLRERERLARELHDTLGQAFAFVHTQGQTVRRLLNRGDIAGADNHVARLVEVAREADTDIRESILALRVTLAEQGLFPALATYLQQYELRYGIHAGLSKPETLGEEAFEPLVEVQLLRIIQEALTNARKHARARSVGVTFAVHDGCAQVTVRDDGRGFDSLAVFSDSGGRVGLRVMRERAEEVGGTLAVQSAAGEGTQVIVTVPLRR